MTPTTIRNPERVCEMQAIMQQIKATEDVLALLPMSRTSTRIHLKRTLVDDFAEFDRLAIQATGEL